jgi:AcrR family transcriptional regulator
MADPLDHDALGIVKLPSGRHGLPRTFVARNQRDRIMLAVADAVSALGYVATTIEDVIQRAGVSRRTFYDHFSGKEEAFLDAYDGASEQLYTCVFAAIAAAEGSQAQLTACLRAFLEFVAREPAYADMCIVEVLTAGPKALERRDRIMGDFARFFDDAVAAESDAVVTPLTSEAMVGGVYEIVYKRVLRRETATIVALLPDLVCFCLLPYAGRVEALAVYEEMRAADGGHAAD